MATGGKEKLYRRPDAPGGTWYIYYFKDGKRVRLSLETENLREAKDRREKILNGEVVRRWGRANKDVTPEDFWKVYKPWAELHKAKSSIDREYHDWQAFLDFAKPKTLGAVTAADVGQFKIHASKALGWSNRTINDSLVRLGALYNHAKNPEVVGYGRGNPFAGFDRLETTEKKVRWLSAEQRDVILWAAATKSRDIYLFTTLCVFAGMRTSEAVQARWEWIDFDKGVVTVGAGKNRRERTVPLHRRLRLALQPIRQTDGYIINGDKQEPGKWRIRYEPKRAFTSIAAAAGVSWCTPHTLRHSFASLAVQSGISLFKVGEWLGHRDPRTTQIYSHLSPADADIDRF